MDRTLTATLTAGAIAFVAVAGLGVFLGFPVTGSLITAAIFAVLSALLIWGAARRADTFHDPNDPSGPSGPNGADPNRVNDLGRADGSAGSVDPNDPSG